MKKHNPNNREKMQKRRTAILSGVLALLVICVSAVGLRAVLSRPANTETVMTDTADISEILKSDTYASSVQTESGPPLNSTADADQTVAASHETDAALMSSNAEAPAGQTETDISVDSSDPAAVKVSAATSSTSSTSPQTSVTNGKTDNNAPDLSGYVVVLDPGHQLHADSAQEPLGPGMSGTKDKCSSGTSGVSTGRPEYEVNLEIALKLQDYLESLGCKVYMTRTTNNVDISNIDRANFALSYSPDVYIRLHCDGSTDSSSRGIGVFVADSGKYAGSLCSWGDLLGSCLSDATGAKYRGCNAGSTYSGLNWAADIPSFLLEMGFMSNIKDDELLSDPDYQQNICAGIADFISQMPNISG